MALFKPGSGGRPKGAANRDLLSLAKNVHTEKDSEILNRAIMLKQKSILKHYGLTPCMITLQDSKRAAERLGVFQ